MLLIKLPPTDQDTVDIPACACQSLPQVLVERGFFPTAPSQPRLAVSIDFLEFYNALFEHTGDAVTAIASALANLYARRGYSVKTDEVSSPEPREARIAILTLATGQTHQGSIQTWIHLRCPMV